MAKRLMTIGTCPALLGHSGVRDAAGRRSHSGIVVYVLYSLPCRKESSEPTLAGILLLDYYIDVSFGLNSFCL